MKENQKKKALKIINQRIEKLEKIKFKYEQYSLWSRQIARTTTKKEIKEVIGICDYNRKHLAASHLKALSKSTSMTSNSQRRAQSKNAMLGNYEKYTAYLNALELYEFYPDKCFDNIRKYIIELEPGVWIADWDGDPGRTKIKENAKVFESRKKAECMLNNCRIYREFNNAIIIKK